MATTATLDTITNIKQIRRTTTNTGYYEWTEKYEAILTDDSVVPLSQSLWNSASLNFCIKMVKSFVTWKYDATGYDYHDLRFSIKSTYGAKFNGTPKSDKFKSVLVGTQDAELLSNAIGLASDWTVGEVIPQNEKDTLVDDTTFTMHKAIETFNIVNHNVVSKIKSAWMSTPLYAGELKNLDQKSKPGDPNSWTNPDDVWIISCDNEVDEGGELSLKVKAKASAVGGTLKWTFGSVEGSVDKHDFVDKRMWGSAVMTSTSERVYKIRVKNDKLDEGTERVLLKAKFDNKTLLKKEIKINNVPNTFQVKVRSNTIPEGGAFYIDYKTPPIFQHRDKPIVWRITPITDGLAKNDFEKKTLTGFIQIPKEGLDGWQMAGQEIRTKTDSLDEDQEHFNIELLYRGELIHSEDASITNVTKGVRTMTSSVNQIDEGESMTVTLNFPDDDTAEDGTEVPFVVSGVSKSDLTVDGARLTKAKGVLNGTFIKGTKETVTVVFSKELNATTPEGDETARFALKFASSIAVDVLVKDKTVQPPSVMKYAYELSGTGTESLSPTLTGARGDGDVTPVTETSWAIPGPGGMPLLVTATAGGSQTTLYGTNDEPLVNGSVEVLLNAGTKLSVVSTDAELTTFRFLYAGTSVANELVAGHDTTNGGWYIIGSKIYYLHVNGRDLNTVAVMVSSAKRWTAGFGTIGSSDKMVISFNSAASWTSNGFEIVDPSGTVLDTIDAVESTLGTGQVSFETITPIDPANYAEDVIYTIRLILEASAAPSVGMKMDPSKMYKFVVSSVDPGPWSNNTMSGSFPSNDDVTPEQQFFTGSSGSGYGSGMGFMVRMSFDIDDQAGGRAEWIHSQTYNRRENSTGNMTTPNTHTTFSSFRVNRLRDKIDASNNSSIYNAEEALPTHETDYNMHAVYLQFQAANTPLTKTISLDMYEVDANDNNIGNAVATLSFDSGQSTGSDGWMAATTTSWTPNTVSNVSG